MRFQSDRPIDRIRRQASLSLDPVRRSELGQFMTPSAIAEFMVSLFTKFPDRSRLLDPGAGVGSLSHAFADRFLARARRGAALEIEAYEIEPLLVQHLSDQLANMRQSAKTHGSELGFIVHDKDFIAESTSPLAFGGPKFTHAILNPPYKKIGAQSVYRQMLRSVGIDTGNLYSAFLGLAIAAVQEGGEIVAIIPRSFCNGTYFRPFRRWLLSRVAIRHIHVFESRAKAFSEDDVLQENIIVHLEQGAVRDAVTVSSSHDSTFSDYTSRRIPFAQIVAPGDPELYIRIPAQGAMDAGWLFSNTLAGLGLEVSTGPVVDFRLRAQWLNQPARNTVPLLYAHHFRNGELHWPLPHKKPNALLLTDETRKWLMPRGWYLLTKRFSTKEEARRIVAYVLDPASLPAELVGFENHLNVFHTAKNGLTAEIARGLATFLNSTVVDRHFRDFSGHTQVNATDLRALGYPSREALVWLGRWAWRQTRLDQARIDAQVEGLNGD